MSALAALTGAAGDRAGIARLRRLRLPALGASPRLCQCATVKGLPSARIRRRSLGLTAAGLAAYALTAATAEAAMPALYKNCTAFNKKYPHGVGRVTARDST